jgi:hypothetical protein
MVRPVDTEGKPELEGHVEARYWWLSGPLDARQIVNRGAAVDNESAQAFQARGLRRDLEYGPGRAPKRRQRSDESDVKRLVLLVERNVEKDVRRTLCCHSSEAYNESYRLAADFVTTRFDPRFAALRVTLCADGSTARSASAAHLASVAARLSLMPKSRCVSSGDAGSSMI